MDANETGRRQSWRDPASLVAGVAAVLGALLILVLARGWTVVMRESLFSMLFIAGSGWCLAASGRRRKSTRGAVAKDAALSSPRPPRPPRPPHPAAVHRGHASRMSSDVPL
jgi:hypothetical protein